MRADFATGPYTNCQGLSRADLRELLSYDPDTGLLVWIGHQGRGGGPRYGTVVNPAVRVTVYGQARNTFGVICRLMQDRLPAHRITFRDGDSTNWRWGNIGPDGWV